MGQRERRRRRRDYEISRRIRASVFRAETKFSRGRVRERERERETLDVKARVSVGTWRGHCAPYRAFLLDVNRSKRQIPQMLDALIR